MTREPPDTLVALRRVTKSYVRGRDTVEVLSDIDLDIARGEFAVLMGPSGSGKSTLLHLIAGVDRPTRGEVTVAGERLDRLSDGQLSRWRAAHIGFVFQFYHLLPELSAEQNVSLPLLLTDMSGSARRDHVEAALELVGLTAFRKRRPRELSGGQQQRVAIARAIIADPTLLVCDEPTGDLDRKSADEIMELLQLLNRRQGKTIVMVTHDAQAAAFGSVQMRLDKGALISSALAA